MSQVQKVRTLDSGEATAREKGSLVSERERNLPSVNKDPAVNPKKVAAGEKTNALGKRRYPFVAEPRPLL